MQVVEDALQKVFEIKREELDGAPQALEACPSSRNKESHEPRKVNRETAFSSMFGYLMMQLITYGVVDSNNKPPRFCVVSFGTKLVNSFRRVCC